MAICHLDFPGGSAVKNLLANPEDVASIPGSGISAWKGNDNPFQYSCWKITWTEEPGGLQSMESQKSWTRLSDWAQTSTRCFRGLWLNEILHVASLPETSRHAQKERWGQDTQHLHKTLHFNLTTAQAARHHGHPFTYEEGQNPGHWNLPHITQLEIGKQNYKSGIFWFHPRGPDRKPGEGLQTAPRKERKLTVFSATIISILNKNIK